MVRKLTAGFSASGSAGIVVLYAAVRAARILKTCGAVLATIALHAAPALPDVSRKFSDSASYASDSKSGEFCPAAAIALISGAPAAIGAGIAPAAAAGAGAAIRTAGNTNFAAFNPHSFTASDLS